MRLLYSFLFFTFFCVTNAFAQVSVTATAATPGPTAYTTLKAAFDAVNAGTHKGAITISINGNTTETASAILDSSGVAASYTSVAINATGAFTITSNFGSPTIQLNGADNVNLNGNSTLQIINTNPSGSVISFIRDARNNIVRNSIIKGATATFTGTATSPVITSGVVHFGTGLLTGNDNNTIDNCDIDGGNAAICLVFSSGSSSTSSNFIFNSGNTLKNSRLYDYINGSIGGAVAVSIANSTEWTVENNSVYFTTPRSTGMQFLFRGILIVPAFTNDFHTVTGNYIGGNSANANGTMSVSASGANALGFIGLDVETGGTGNMVSNNSVKNITITYATSAGSYSNSGIFGFIGGYNGITTLTGNTVSNINFSNTSGFIQFNPIHVNGRVTSAGQTVRPIFNITNNTVSAITLGSGGTAGDIALTAIRLETSSSASLSSGAEKANPFFNVTGNTISNLSSVFPGVAASYIRGIATSTAQGTSSAAQLHPKIDISNNTIHTFSNASSVGSFTAPSTYANYSVPVVVGINFGGSSGSTANTTDTARINGNTIYNLNATNAGNNGVVATGILASTGILEVTKNKVYGLTNAATGSFTPRPAIIGLNIRRTDGAQNSLVANNFVSLGSGAASAVQVFGILNNFVGGTGPLQVFHNTIVVTGATTTGFSMRSSAFHRGTEEFGSGVTTPVTVKNNIFYNTRTGNISQYALSNSSTPPSTGFVSDYNNFYSANFTDLILWGTTEMNLATYKTNSGDANSRSTTVSFVDVPNGDLHLAGASITDANLKAIPVPNVTVDYDNDARSATAPTMGADEGSAPACAIPAITTQPANQTACSGGSATFTVTATGDGLTYQWKKNGIDISGATSATYTISSVVASDAANYTVVVSGTCGSPVTSTAATLTVGGAPVINTQPTAQTVCANSAATFTVAASGSGLTYQWRKGGVDIAGATSATYTIASASAADAGSYDVVVTSPCATTATSNAATLTVNAVTAIGTQPSAQTVCAGAQASFTVAATGTNLSYQWRKGGVDIAGATSATYTIATTTAASAGSYDVVVSGTCGNVTSNAVNLTVNAVTAIGTQPSAQTVCAGAPASFTVAATGTNLTYQWRKGGTNIAGATAATYTIAAVAAGDAANYDVVVSGTCGNVTSNAVALALQTTGCTTSVPVIDSDVESALITPNVTSANTTLRLVVKRTMKVNWVITDANGREVKSFTSQASPGSNEFKLYVQELAGGIYYVNGHNSKGQVASLKFIKQ